MQSICAVDGVSAAGIKEGKFGLALVKATGTAAGVFTQNLVRAAPVEVMMERIRSGRLEGIIVNSGCANAYTGKRGYNDALRMAEIGGDALGVDPDNIGIASTGVIGRYLDLPLIEDQSRRVAPLMKRSAETEAQVARAIMTTDLVEKHALVRTETFTIGGVAKGSGMIAPNMGTMLAFLYTDAEIEAELLRDSLRMATQRSFNRVVVDGDTSTNDVCFCTATGERGRVPEKEFEAALLACCISLAKQIASDGEGAKKLLEVRVSGAPSEEDATMVARTIVTSPLVKTAVHGEDPNWGRVVAAAGRAGVFFNPDELTLYIGNGQRRTILVKNGKIAASLRLAKRMMASKTVVFDLDLGEGEGCATAWGCDLSEGYVEINGKYTT